MVAPAVAADNVTVCAVAYTPGTGENMGVAAAPEGLAPVIGLNED